MFAPPTQTVIARVFDTVVAHVFDIRTFDRSVARAQNGRPHHRTFSVGAFRRERPLPPRPPRPEHACQFMFDSWCECITFIAMNDNDTSVAGRPLVRGQPGAVRRFGADRAATHPISTSSARRSPLTDYPAEHPEIG